MRIIGNNPAAENAEITAIASGTMADGKAVVVNADGTVSVVGSTTVSQALGTAAVFESGNIGINKMGSAFDPTSGKIVISYRDSGNSFYVTAVAGTVSGTSISFGTPAVIISVAGGDSSVAFDSNSNKFVIAYTGGSDYGRAVVATLSGTDLSFGSENAFSQVSTVEINAVFDSSNNKIVVAYRDNNNGLIGKAIVLTVDASNNTLSKGSAATFRNNTIQYMSAAFDSNSNKTVIIWQDAGNSNAGKAVVATVSGTSISFGTVAQFAPVNTQKSSITFDSTNNKIVILVYLILSGARAFRAVVGTVSGTDISFGDSVVISTAGTDSEYNSIAFDSNLGVVVAFYRESAAGKGTFATGTVSGTSISFNTPAVFEEGSTTTITSTFDSNSNKVVVGYRDVDNSNQGTAIVLQPPGSAPNLTAENFIGFANGAASDTGTARVQIGSGINGAQSSLTAGQQYFVQTDGTLGLTAADPSVIAGTAVSATDIIVKG